MTPWEPIFRQGEEAHVEGLRVVLATGVFDVLHTMHQTFLHDARTLGDVLVVGVESDIRVRALKGSERPIQPAAERIQAIVALGITSLVQVLPETFGLLEVRRAFITRLRPDILAVSSHSPHQKEKQMLLDEVGGRLVVVTQQNPEYSTTKYLAQQQRGV